MLTEVMAHIRSLRRRLKEVHCKGREVLHILRTMSAHPEVLIVNNNNVFPCPRGFARIRNGGSRPVRGGAREMSVIAPVSGLESVQEAGEPEEEEAEEGKFNVTETKEEETLCEEKKNLALPAVILLHGFGGSLFSFERVLKPLSSIFRSPVLAFDRPGFGLTSRVKLPGELVWPENIMTSDSDMVSSLPINPYSIGFSSSATLAFMDFVQSKEAVLMG